MDKYIIGKNLLRLRGEIPREKVAEAIDISISALQMYENGKRIPRDEIKIRLAEYYNTSVQAIFFEYEQHKKCVL